jgi:hypothetical protein
MVMERNQSDFDRRPLGLLQEYSKEDARFHERKKTMILGFL